MRSTDGHGRRRARGVLVASLVLLAPAGAWLAHAALVSPPAEAIAPRVVQAVPASSADPARTSPVPATATEPTTAPVPAAAAASSTAAAAAGRLDALLADVPTRASVAIVDLATGTAFGYHDERRFPAASVVKVDILAALLLQAQDAGRPLSADADELAVSMIEQSDNDAADLLWESIGG
ncbi:MAG: class A beta-lactamase-related serine hydrolase, partial [Actinomycetota bacterium]|nr:class A beta-lactamase-related serine hydrolase [Actinomycetota bacterium]